MVDMMNTILRILRGSAWLPVLLIMAIAPMSEETDDYIHYRLGVKFKNENNFDQAVDEFRKVLTSYPDNYNAYMQLAEIRKSQGQSRLEMFNLKKALAFNPGWGKAHKMLAEAYASDKQFQNAIMELQLYQQSCDPAERESVQKQIDKLIKKVQGGRDEEEKAPIASSPNIATNDSAKEKGATDNTTSRPNPSTAPTIVFRKESPKPASSVAQKNGAESMLNKAVAFYEQGKFEAALPYVKKALLLRPNYAEAYFYGGVMRYKLGQFDLAKVNFTKSFTWPFASVSAHYYLGKIFGAEKYFKGAVNELTAFIAKAPDGDQKREALQLLADFKKQINDTTSIPASAGAFIAAKETSKPQPENEPSAPESGYAVIEMRIDSLLTMQVVDTLTNPGQAMLTGVKKFKEGRFDDAIKEFKKVMASYPSSSVAAPSIYNIGVCYMKLRLFPNADNQFDNLRYRYPNHPLAAQGLFLKALSLYERGDMTRCEKLFREFILKYRNHSWTGKAYEKLGDVYVDLKQLNKAMDAYQHAASLPKDVFDQVCAYFKLGNAAFEAGNPERAMASFKKAIEMGESRKAYTRVPDSYYKIADILYQQKDFKNAFDYYQKVTRRYPGYQETPWGLFQMGNIHKNMKNYQKAIDIYKELITDHPDDYWAKQARWKLDDAVWENEYKTVLQ